MCLRIAMTVLLDDSFHVVCIYLFDLTEICPLVRIGYKIFINENTVALPPGLTLQEKGNQVAKAAVGQHILAGEHPVIGIQL